jgi:GGDEF domain-containing protein
MPEGSEHRFLQRTDRTGAAWALGGLLLVALAIVAFNGTGPGSAFATAVAAAYGFALSAALLRRNTQRWRRTTARIEEETRRRLASSEQVSSFSPRVFLDRLAQECRRSHRYGLELAVIRMRCDQLHVAHLGRSDTAGVAVVTAAAEHLRSEDVVGRLSETEFAFFLPHTNRAGAEVVLERLEGLGALAESMGIAVLGEDAGDANGLLLAAERDAERRFQLAETKRKWNQKTIVS